MKELQKDRLKRWFHKKGIRISKSGNNKYTFDKNNFTSLVYDSSIIIFDIGANVGQSSIWLQNSFPSAKIFAFEPLVNVYNKLITNTQSYSSISCHNLALGQKSEKITIPLIESDTIQTVNVFNLKSSAGDKSIDVDVRTVEQIMEEFDIERISILKTDTEGSDLEVLKGAENHLKNKNIKYIISEASLFLKDTEHTNLFKLKEYLDNFDYELYSLCDLYHSHTGDLVYFNALFRSR